MKRRIGFIGCYSHDVILMLTRAMASMGKKVLLRDCNRHHTLRASLPIPEDMETKLTVLEYDGFWFTEKGTDSAVTEAFDFELVDLGMEGAQADIVSCGELIVITDILLHHIRRLERIQIPKEKVKICVMRDSYEEVCKNEQEIQNFLRSFPDKKVFYLPTDVRDVKNRYVCETLHEYNIGKASYEMQDMIYRLAKGFCPEFSEKEIRRCIKHRERRRYR